jgi:aspartyl-tRNA synthetase
MDPRTNEGILVTTSPRPDRARGLRTDYGGNLNLGDVGREVSLCGWVARRREHGEKLAFVDLRDRSGIIQCVVDGAADLRNEYVVRVTGTVTARSADTINVDLPTGEIELQKCTVEVLNIAEPPMFPLADREGGPSVDENLRLKHRYLDLRRDRMQRNLRLRSKINQAIRNSMDDQGFTEVETPMLMPSTPEGAREFVVPSRLTPGSFYALPQSPQLFKQLLMVAGADRYFQIARCMRDEDLRADRQFEFTQLDAEMSFVGQDDVLECISEAVLAAATVATGSRPIDVIPRMTWTQAMEEYGSDKPDVRFAMKLVELTPLFAKTEAKVFQTPSVKGLRVPGGAEMTRNRIDQLTDFVKQLGAKGLAWFKVKAVGDAPEVEGPVAKFMNEAELKSVLVAMEASAGDLLFFQAGELDPVRTVLGALRLEIGKPPINEGLSFLWIVDFPMFHGSTDAGNPIPAHHPFTHPHIDDVDRLESDPFSVRAQAYDLTLNGWELGSGSIRIHKPDLQQRIFNLLGISPEEAQKRFGFFLNPFKYGAPPHGGFAFGIDRLTAILAGEENIREVIAFPKTQSGLDPMTGSPTPIVEKHLTELGLRTLPPKA